MKMTNTVTGLLGNIKHETRQAVSSFEIDAKAQLGRVALSCVRLRSSMNHVSNIVRSQEPQLHSSIHALIHIAMSELVKLETTILEHSNWNELMYHAADDLHEAIRVAEMTMCEVAKDEAALREQVAGLEASIANLNGKFARLCEHRLNHEHVRERVLAMTDGKCFYCQVALLKDSSCEGNPKHVFEVDHLVPKSLGGPDHVANFVPACAGCNGEKSNKPFVEFYLARRAAPVLRVVAGGES